MESDKVSTLYFKCGEVGFRNIERDISNYNIILQVIECVNSKFEKVIKPIESDSEIEKKKNRKDEKIDKSKVGRRYIYCNYVKPPEKQLLNNIDELFIVIITDSKYTYKMYSETEIYGTQLIKLKSINRYNSIPIIINYQIIQQTTDSPPNSIPLDYHPLVFGNIKSLFKDDEEEKESNNSNFSTNLKRTYNESSSSDNGSGEFESILLTKLEDCQRYACDFGHEINSVIEYKISKYLVNGFNNLYQQLQQSTSTSISTELSKYFKYCQPDFSKILSLCQEICSSSSPLLKLNKIEIILFIYLLSHLNHIPTFNKSIKKDNEINVRFVYILTLTILGLNNTTTTTTTTTTTIPIFGKIDKFYKLICNNNNTQTIINNIKIQLNNSILAVYNNISSEQSLQLKYNYIDLKKSYKLSLIQQSFRATQNIRENFQIEAGIEDEFTNDDTSDIDDYYEENGEPKFFYSYFEQHDKFQSFLTTPNQQHSQNIIKVYQENVILDPASNFSELYCKKELFTSLFNHGDGTGIESNGCDINSEEILYKVKNSQFNENKDKIGYNYLYESDKDTVVIETDKYHKEYLKNDDDYDLYYDLSDDGEREYEDEGELHLNKLILKEDVIEKKQHLQYQSTNIGNYSINPSLSLFKKCFSIYTHGMFDESKFNWGNGSGDKVQVVITGSAVTACIDGLPIEIKKEYVWLLQVQRLLYKSSIPKYLIKGIMNTVEKNSIFHDLVYSKFHNYLSHYYLDHNVELSLIYKGGNEDDVDKKESIVDEKIREIFKQICPNFASYIPYFIRTGDSIVFQPQFPYHSIRVKLQVYGSIQEIITLGSLNELDCLNAVYDGSNVFMSASTIYSFNSRYNLLPSFRYANEFETKDPYSEANYDYEFDDGDELNKNGTPKLIPPNPIQSTYIGFKTIKWDYDPNNITCNYHYYNHKFDYLDPNVENHPKQFITMLNTDNYGERNTFTLPFRKLRLIQRIYKYRPTSSYVKARELIRNWRSFLLIMYEKYDYKELMVPKIRYNLTYTIESFGFYIRNLCLQCNLETNSNKCQYSNWCTLCLSNSISSDNSFNSKHVVIILKGYGDKNDNYGTYDEIDDDDDDDDDIEMEIGDGDNEDDDDEGNEEDNDEEFINKVDEYESYGYQMSLEFLHLGFNVTIVSTMKNKSILKSLFDERVSDGLDIEQDDLKRLTILSPLVNDNNESFISSTIDKIKSSSVPKIDILINSVYQQQQQDIQQHIKINNNNEEINEIDSKKIFSNLSNLINLDNHIPLNQELLEPDDDKNEIEKESKLTILFTGSSIIYDINGDNQQQQEGHHLLKICKKSNSRSLSIINNRFTDINNNKGGDCNSGDDELSYQREGNCIFVKCNTMPLIDSSLFTIYQIFKYFIKQSTQVHRTLMDTKKLYKKNK